MTCATTPDYPNMCSAPMKEVQLRIGRECRLIPPAIAKENIVSRRLEPPLAENLREIMNVCSQLFVASESGRITLQSVSSAAQCGSEEAKKMVSAPSQKCGMKLSIEGYGDGMVSLLT